MKSYKFIDLSGYGGSGKTALINIFQELEGFHAPHHSFEFGLIRIKDGIFDLEDAIVNTWSPSRGDTALKRFDKLIWKIGYNPCKFNIIGRLFSSGMRYNKYFNGEFESISYKYRDELVKFQYNSISPYPFQNMNIFRYAIKKVLNTVFGRKIFLEIFFITVNKIKFYQATNEYFNKLFGTIVNENVHSICLYNACEPFNIERAFNIFPNLKQIIVDRDPRDIYLSSLEENIHVGKDHQNISGSDSLVSFVRRYKELRMRTGVKENDKLIKINFEDLVLDYENTLSRIFTFLGEDKSIHINKKKYFDPEISKAGVGMWKNTDKKEEIKYIYENLKEYCKDY